MVNAQFQFHGQGKLTHKDDYSVLRGNFFNGLAHGKCVYESMYEYFDGFYNAGERQGTGILKQASG